MVSCQPEIDAVGTIYSGFGHSDHPQDVLTVLHRRRSRVRVQGYEAMSSVTLFQLLFRYHSFASKYNFDLTSKTAMLKSFLEWSFKSSLPVIIEIMSCT